MEYKKKLIEVALPLEAINAESAREKSIRHGHPSTLHLWWARRPLATARAVIWSSLVDDPSSHPELFPTEELQKKERDRLFDILSRLIIWDNCNDPTLLAEAKVELIKSTNGNPPALLDPFAGGGSIPLEAHRLGLEAHAHDLNPVAVMINKAMIEIPPKFSGTAPINPSVQNGQIGANHAGVWQGSAGLAQDVLYYGEWMKKRAFEKIGHLYPKAKISNKSGSNATVIAWLWARTAKCSNPACGCIIPCTSSYVLSKKKGNCAWVVPKQDGDRFRFDIRYGATLPKDLPEPKKGRGATFVCPACGQTTLDEYIKEQGRSHRLGYQLMAIVAEGDHGRIYLAPEDEQIRAADVPAPEDYPDGILPTNPRWFSPPAFGMETYASLFTNRQLTALTTFSSLVWEAQKQAEKDAIQAGMFNDHISLEDGGNGARAYGEAIGVYLAFAVDKAANLWSSIVSWMNDRGAFRETFSRQALPMVWDFAEANPFSNSGGNFSQFLERIVDTICYFPTSNKKGIVRQFDAQSDNGLRGIMICTDPPYYDNIGYADLSDYFYVWLRQALRATYPNVFRTVLVPKSEELIATPTRHDGSMEKAKVFFEDGMFRTCCQLYRYADDNVPVTIYYAFKQSDTDEDAKVASSGWETMLSAIIRAGFSITGTWPMRTESAGRAIAQGANALASSIILVCRKRSQTAVSVTRREFINALHREMRPALQALQSANIAPVDLAQSAIGPGIGVFSRYKSVVEADGSPMSVRAALQIINQELDAFYNEQEGELDAKSRFCVDIFNQYAFNTMKFGDADILARAKNTSVQALVDEGVMEASKGTVRLKTREEIPEKVDGMEDCCWKITQQLARAFEKGGIKETAAVVSQLKGYIAENAKQLAYRLYTICERKNWAAEGYAYNNLIVAWPDIQSEAARMQAETPVQMNMFDNA